MTGYNHYPDCTCGWCVNHGRTRINLSDLRASYRRHEAESFLKKNGARSVAGCYIKPNARCPICGAEVFFYANEFGSRVYFDDLGPPWPKHPCTDNPRQKTGQRLAFSGPPIRRARGITQELIDAARITGAFSTPAAEGSRWQLLIIVAVERDGSRNTVQAEYLASDRNKRVAFTCHSDEPIFEIDDFISKNGDEFSILHRRTLSALTFLDGGWAHPRDAEKPPSSAPQPKPSRTRSRTPERPVLKAITRPGKARTFDMTRQEMAHFHSKKKSVQQLCDELLPVVRAYAKNGIRKPRQVAEKLNRDGYRTLLGARWTPRLTYFLLGLIFMPSPKSASAAKVNHATETSGGLTGSSDPMTPEEMARRLSQLGRVVVSGES